MPKEARVRYASGRWFMGAALINSSCWSELASPCCSIWCIEVSALVTEFSNRLNVCCFFFPFSKYVGVFLNHRFSWSLNRYRYGIRVEFLQGIEFVRICLLFRLINAIHAFKAGKGGPKVLDGNELELITISWSVSSLVHALKSSFKWVSFGRCEIFLRFTPKRTPVVWIISAWIRFIGF